MRRYGLTERRFFYLSISFMQSMQCNPIRCNAMQCNAIQSNPIDEHYTRTVKNMSSSASSSSSSSIATTNRASSKWWLSRWYYTKSKYHLLYCYGIPLFGGFILILILLQGRTFVRVNSTNSNNDNVYVDYIDTLPTIVETITTETLPNGDIVTTATTSSTTTTAIINESNNDNNTSNNNNTDNDDERPIELLVSIEDGIWIRDRSKQFQKWFKESKNITIIKQSSKNKKLGNDKFSKEQLLKLNSDSVLPGPILDFVIVGSAKTGTTTLLSNLGKIAPMPSAKDICLSPENILSMAYNDWPKQYNVSKITIPSLVESELKLELELNENENDTKPFKQQEQQPQEYGIHLKGSKCPSLLGLPMLKRYSQALPKTKFIIGIRHPITWFQSFWKMQGNNGPYERTQMCPCAPHDNPTQNNLFKNDSQIYDSLTRRCTIIPEDDQDNNNNNKNNKSNRTAIVVGCKNECGYKLFCTARARFHLSLARLGKTPLTSNEERNLLAPNDPDGGVAENGLRSWNVTNDIFVYDQTQLNEDYLWDGLASFLQVSRIPHDTNQRQYSKGKNQSQLNICDPLYDSFRAIMMKSSYEMSVWLEHYFLPVAFDSNRTDVTIVSGPNNNFLDIIQSYKLDPCERLLLVRNNDNDNKNNDVKYILDPSFNTTIIPPPPNRKKYDYQIRTVADDDPSNNNNNNNNKREKKKKDLKKDKEKRARKQQGNTIKKK